MIASGSNTVNADDFGLPAGTALRYERPAADLAPYFPSYVVFDSDLSVWKGPGE